MARKSDALITAEKKEKKAGATKRGALSKGEKGTLLSLVGKVSTEAIATKMGRSVESVERAIKELTGVETSHRVPFATQLVSRPEWRQFQKQFNAEELEEFKHQYVQIMSQMDDDLKPTEELQIFQVITLKIEIDRTLAAQRMALDDMQESHAELRRLRDEFKETGDELLKPEIFSVESRYESAKRTNKDCAEQYKIYSDKQDKMLNALKATRDQRVQFYENSQHSFPGMIRFLMEEENRLRAGEEAELHKIASQKEKDRLSKPHKYEDGTYDQPLLTPENIIDDEEL